MTIHLTGQDIAFVSELAVKAGIRAAQMREGVTIRDKTSPEDRVTAADLELSGMIVSALSERFPRDVIVSEEDEKQPQNRPLHERVWLIDPIDGTDNYIKNDGQWAVMIGLIVATTPVFGWVYAPATGSLYYGGPGFGAWKNRAGQEPIRFKPLDQLDSEANARVMMGFRDRKKHSWVQQHPKVTLVKAGSIGLKMAKVLEGEGDVFVHLSGQLKTWDTAGPAAVALGGQLDVGSLEKDGLPFDTSKVRQECSVIMGRPGSLAWSRKYLRQAHKVNSEDVANN